MAVDPLKAGLGSFLAAYDLPMLKGGFLSRAMRSAGFEPLKYRGKIDGWTGIALQESVPAEAVEARQGEDAFRQRSVIGGVFTAHCLRKARFEGAATQTRMLTAFRCWCIRFRLKPLSAKELARELRIQAPLSRSAGRSGEREYEGVSVTMPRPDEFAFATERARRRRDDW